MVASKENTEYTKVKQIPSEERQEIEEMLAEGETPLVISEETGIPLQLIQSIRRMNSRVVERPLTLDKPSNNPTMNAIRQQLQDQVERTMLENQLEDLQDERAYKREKRRLELQQIRQDQRMQRLDMRAEYADEPEDIDEEPMPQLADGVLSSVLDGENAWIGDIIKFATTLKSKPPKAKAEEPMTPDFTKPLSLDQVNAELKKFSKTEVSFAKKNPKVLESELKRRFPGILPENINTIQTAIRHYVDNS